MKNTDRLTQAFIRNLLKMQNVEIRPTFAQIEREYEKCIEMQNA